MIKGLRGFIGLLLLALVSWWFSTLFSVQQIQTDGQEGNIIDYYGNEIEMTVTDEKGVPKHRLKAAAISHFIESDTTELKKPVVTIFDPSKPPWIIRSDTGTVSPNGERVFFGGNVFIDRTGTKADRPVKIVTKNLWVEPDRKFAETDEEADIASLSDTIKGVGMRVFFEGPVRLSLLSKVRGKYEAH